MASKSQRARGGRGRPHSAAAVLSSRLQPTVIYDPSSLNSNDTKAQKLAEPKAIPRPDRTILRPSSAAPTSTSQVRRPIRPTRPRPITASDMHSAAATANRSTLTGQRKNRGRRRVVRAGSAPSVSGGIVLQAGGTKSHGKHRPGDKKRRSSCNERNLIISKHSGGVGDLLAARGPAWGHDLVGDAAGGCPPVEEGGDGKMCSNGSFWHKHDNLGPDPAVMQRAEDFVAEILRTNNGKPVGNCQQLQFVERPPPASFNLNERASSCKPRQQGARENKKGKTFRREGSVRVHDRRHAQRYRKARSKAAAGKSVVGKKSLVVATRVETDDKSTPREADVAIASAQALDDEFPFPSNGDSRGDKKGTDRASSDLLKSEGGRRRCTAGNPGSLDSDAIGGTTACPPTKEEESESSRMVEGRSRVVTPLALDIFCALRPTLDHKHPRSNRPKACVSTKGGSQRSGHNSRNTSLPVPPSARSREGHKVTASWMSVFGAICAGAARGRARAEVLTAARKKSSRIRRAAAQSVCIGVPTQIETDVATEAKLGERSSPPASTLSGVSNVGGVIYGGSQSEVYESAARSPNQSATWEASTDGEVEADVAIACDSATGVVVGDGRISIRIVDDEGAVSASVNHRRQARNNPDGGADTDGITLETSVDSRDRHQASSVQDSFSLSPAITVTATSPPTESRISPIFRYPCGLSSTRVTVSAPRSLQVSPGGRGLSGVNTSAYSPVRRHREQRGSCRRPPIERPWTAGADWHRHGEESTGTCAGSRAGMAEMRPKTAGRFFPRSNGSHEGLRCAGVR